MNIHELTSESILSDEVFEELFALEPIARERLKQQITDKAHLLNVKTKFLELFKIMSKLNNQAEKEKRQLELREANKKKRDDKEIAMSCFMHPTYPEIHCGNWECGENGVKTFNMFGEVIACYNPIMPVCRLVNIQTQKEKMVVAYKKDMYWREQAFDKSILLSASKIVSAMADYGILVTSETAKHLVKYFAEIECLNNKWIITKKSTSKMGWFGDDFIPFVNDEIEFDAEGSFKNLYESIRSKGNKKAYMQHVKKIRKHSRKEPLFCMAVSLASVLVKPLGVLPFIFHLYGEGGKGKTISLMLGASVWGDTNEATYITDPKSTKTAFEMRLNFLNNLPLICDDMAQVKKYMSSQKGSDFSEFIYLVCSGRGNERSNINLGLNAVPEWKNAILTSSEKPITSEVSQGGELLRVIDYEVKAGNIFEEPKQTADFLRSNFGHIGRDFIEIIQENQLLVETLNTEFIEKLKALDPGGEKEGKQLIPMALILTADKLATDFIFQDGIYLDINECFRMIKSNKQMSDNERAYEFIMNEVEINKINFDGDIKTKDWGRLKTDDGVDYVLINNNIFSDFAERGNFSKKMFIEWAYKNDLALKDKDRITKKHKDANGKTQNYITIIVKDLGAEDNNDDLDLLNEI